MSGKLERFLKRVLLWEKLAFFARREKGIQGSWRDGIGILRAVEVHRRVVLNEEGSVVDGVIVFLLDTV
jgi:hypothetical protein